MAGLLLYLNEENYLYAYVTHEEEQGRVLRLMKCAANDFSYEAEAVPLGSGDPVHLAAAGEGSRGQIYFRTGAEPGWKKLYEPQELGFLSGGFTGNFIGIAAHDMGQFAGSYADFASFRYEGKDH
ncbi:Beta-xylosidase [compost metagenome]